MKDDIKKYCIMEHPSKSQSKDLALFCQLSCLTCWFAALRPVHITAGKCVRLSTVVHVVYCAGSVGKSTVHREKQDCAENLNLLKSDLSCADLCGCSQSLLTITPACPSLHFQVYIWVIENFGCVPESSYSSSSLDEKVIGSVLEKSNFSPIIGQFLLHKNKNVMWCLTHFEQYLIAVF